jgi:NADH pyrophosphatase NudC (nudix superfamily)
VRDRDHSPQPWLIPSSLMIGCHGVGQTTGIAIANLVIRAWADGKVLLA